MPLIQGKSRKSLQKNIETEMHAHPEQKDRNLAIAYNVQRKNKKRMMADGGEVTADSRLPESMDMLKGKSLSHAMEQRAAAMKPDADDAMTDRDEDMLKMAKGGMIMEPKSIAEAIRNKRMMAEGGEVDLQDSNGDEHLNEEDDLSFEAARKKTYFDDSQLDAQPMDSNEHSDNLTDEDANDKDMVSIIRSRMKRKML